MSFLDIILGVQLGILAALASVWAAIWALVWATERFATPLPACCDVDPRCHPAYYHDPVTGHGWIGSVCIKGGA